MQRPAADEAASESLQAQGRVDKKRVSHLESKDARVHVQGQGEGEIEVEVQVQVEGQGTDRRSRTRKKSADQRQVQTEVWKPGFEKPAERQVRFRFEAEVILFEEDRPPINIKKEVDEQRATAKVLKRQERLEQDRLARFLPKFKVFHFSSVEDVFEEKGRRRKEHKLKQAEERRGEQLKQQQQLRDTMHAIRNLRRCHCRHRGRRGSHQHHDGDHRELPFVKWMDDMTIFDVQTLVPLHDPFDTDRRNSDLPVPVKALLALGDKYVIPGQFPTGIQIDTAIQAFVRKLRLRLFFSNDSREEARARPTKLPKFKPKSTFNPPADEQVEKAILEFTRQLRDNISKAQNENKIRKPYIFRKAIPYLREMHEKNEINKISSDKNYGPAVVSSRMIQQQMTKESEGGSYPAVRVNDIIDKMFAVFDGMVSITQTAVSRGYIDKATRDFLLSGFRRYNFERFNLKSKQELLANLGKLRFIIKLHKKELGLRRIEVDVRNPMNEVGTFVAKILGNAARKLDSVVLDSKQILVELQNGLPPGRCQFASIDIVNYFPKIIIEKLHHSLLACLAIEFENDSRLVDFVCRLCSYILDNKFLQVRKRLRRKARSLSIGEKIATDAANIHRHFTFKDIWDQHSNAIEKKWGYVDDMAFVYYGPREELDRMIQQMNMQDPEQFEWTSEISEFEMNMLDLTIMKSNTFDVDGSVITTTFRKPMFKPMYLSPLSMHPAPCKAGIASGEVLRMLINNNTEQGFNSDVERLRGFLRARGYTLQGVDVRYDRCKRQRLIDKFADRNRTAGSRSSAVFDDITVTFVMPYFMGAAQARLKRVFQKTLHGVPRLASLKVRVAYSNSTPLFLKQYPLNFERGRG